MTLTGGLIALGRPIVMTLIHTSVLAVTIALLLLLLPRDGIVAAGWISVLTYTLTTLAMAAYLLLVRNGPPPAASDTIHPIEVIGTDLLSGELSG